MKDLVAIPTAWTPIASRTFKLQEVLINNPTAGPLQFYLRSGEASPVYLFDGFELPGEADYTDDFAGGELRDGVEWKASGVGLLGMITGYES